MLRFEVGFAGTGRRTHLVRWLLRIGNGLRVHCYLQNPIQPFAEDLVSALDLVERYGMNEEWRVRKSIPKIVVSVSRISASLMLASAFDFFDVKVVHSS